MINSNDEILFLRIIYCVGYGIISLKHARALLGLKHRTQLWRYIQKLKEKGLVRTIKHSQSSYIVLSRRARMSISTEQQKPASKITSFSIRRSNYLFDAIGKCTAYQGMNYVMTYLLTRTNFLRSEASDLTFFLAAKKHMLNNNMDTTQIDEEIQRLNILSQYTPRKFEKYFSYIEGFGRHKQHQINILRISIHDMTTDFSSSKIVRYLKDILDYYDNVFGNSIYTTSTRLVQHYQITIYTYNSDRELYIRRQITRALRTSKVDVMLLKRTQIFTRSVNNA